MPDVYKNKSFCTISHTIIVTLILLILFLLTLLGFYNSDD